MMRSVVACVLAATLVLGACGEKTPPPISLVHKKLGGEEGAAEVIVRHYQGRAEERGTHRWITDEGIVAFGECIRDYVAENLGRYEILLVAYDFAREQNVLKQWEKNKLRDSFIRFREKNPVAARELVLYRTTALQKIHDEVLLAPCESRAKRLYPDRV